MSDNNDLLFGYGGLTDDGKARRAAMPESQGAVFDRLTAIGDYDKQRGRVFAMLELARMAYKMDEDTKRLWLEALRSGEYKQTQGVLFRLLDDDKTYVDFTAYTLVDDPEKSHVPAGGACCLGVLGCVLGIKPQEFLKSKATYTILGNMEVAREVATIPLYLNVSMVPGDLAARFVLDRNVQSELSTLNDDGACTFAEIADVIEAFL